MDKVKSYYKLDTLSGRPEDLTRAQVDGYVDMLSDSIQGIGIDTAAKAHARHSEDGSETFFYFYKYEAALSLANLRKPSDFLREDPR